MKSISGCGDPDSTAVCEEREDVMLKAIDIIFQGFEAFCCHQLETKIHTPQLEFARLNMIDL